MDDLFIHTLLCDNKIQGDLMLLFQKQWNEEYPDAIVDMQTKNESFIRYSALLKSMGVQNHLWPLVLLNKDLVGVDPFSPNLTIDQINDIVVEARFNPMYFFREIARDPKGTKENPLIFRANRGNMALIWLFFNHITVILIQIRQTGKSFSTDILMTYLLNIRCKKTEINLLTKDDTLRASNLERLKNIQSELPFYLKQKHRGDIGNTEELSVKSLGNRYRGHVPNKSPKMALNVGRGLVSPIFQIDEAAFVFNIAISLPAALAAGTAERDRARSLDEPYGTIITTTAGKKDDPDGAYMFKMVQDSATWNEKFFDAVDLEDLYKIISKNSTNGSLDVNCTFNHRQLGFTDDWLRRAIREAKAVGEDADRDFGNVWTSGSQSSPLTATQLGIIRDSQVLEPHFEIASPYSYVTRWYVDAKDINRVMNSEHHIMSIDSSDASGGDDIAMSIRSTRTGAIIGAGTYNETNIITFCEWLCTCLDRFEKMVLIIERRSTGAVILDYLLLMLPVRNIDPFVRLYNRCVQDADEDPERYKEISKPLYLRSPEIYTKYKKTFGFATSANGATSRTDLYSTTLQNAAKLMGDKVKDKKTIDQLLSLIIRNGRVDHPPGGNDDHVMSWLLSAWLLTLGRNLQHYGINSREVLIDNKINKEINSPQVNYDRARNEQARLKIESLVAELKRERDPYVARHLENSLRAASLNLNDEDRRILSVDDLLMSLKEERTKSFARRYF
jgi:hypothetical protein